MIMPSRGYVGKPESQSVKEGANVSSVLSDNPQEQGNLTKLIFLLDTLGEPLPEIEDLAKLPAHLLRDLDELGPDGMRALLIEVVGRWDMLKMCSGE